MTNASFDRTYRILNLLEKTIRDVEDIVIPEVRNGIKIWKERVHLSTLFVVSLLVMLGIAAEIQFGILEVLIDPVIGPVAIGVLIAILVPSHILLSKLHAKLIINKLSERQKELHLMENLANLFEKNITFVRMILPIYESAGWNKKIKAQLTHLTDKTKDLVQSLNDIFGATEEQIPIQPIKEEHHTNYLDLSKLKE